MHVLPVSDCHILADQDFASIKLNMYLNAALLTCETCQ